MSAAARPLAWLLFAALLVVTLAPIGYRPVSAAPVSLERFGAFALLGFLFAAGYPRRRWQVLALTLAAAGLLEILQMLQPTRHGRVADFAVKAAGCGLGGLAALAIAHRRKAPEERG
ncbi:VanZ family protein [Methylobacterium oxalidis]|uniref:VanZ family protein n=1 Tax=Methylobacterium oxalidis TaxID=944322 RepID=UPI003315AF2E